MGSCDDKALDAIDETITRFREDLRATERKLVDGAAASPPRDVYADASAEISGAGASGVSMIRATSSSAGENSQSPG
jgi:hypothetical protein